MTFERTPGPPAEPGPTPVLAQADPAATPAPTSVQLRLQILSTEHWSLLASRSLAWNESFSRAGMFLSTLSGSIVALSLIGGVDGFHDAFFAVALVVLPIVLFVGLGTWLRMGATNYHDAIAVAGMNRIRAAYLEIAPELEPYFVMGVHDDPRGIGVTMAVPPGTPALVHLIAGTPTLVVVLNAVVGGAIAALVVLRSAAPGLVPTVAVALVVSAVLLAIQTRVAARNIRRGQRALRPMFPTPGATDDLGSVFTERIPYARPPDDST
jgi:hypothetical protein